MLLNATIIIDSKPEKVREIFLDFRKHSQWNPFFTDVRIYTPGVTSPSPGTQLEIKMKLNGGNENIMYPIVLENNSSSFKWKGNLLFDFMFVGVHSFEFIPLEIDGQTRTKLVQSEDFSGILSYVFEWTGLKDKTEKGFNELNRALKIQVEQDN
ncbi:DEHA2D00814p [Debaryomyces hansenii CBS767]|uniref:DEHA2D00814p n=1 Tax=Debaryomyces hansenii (strain ATCC 36239 / CBS 767 / BCRC 21394 / JCM 1990 / NBRC 0083 / IGC 2968) TaxID=284592 RepID=Q6BTG5_DEBHA|nr:DEHA2D00814p [Debaryomyces hansenii CBS767]CAG86619.2 DEHA2D00814p [Debaryomyces hansenii CBS767]|eukprot:XP_458504.2 DEHA2D00814p [Debaryomyces hansenii CBS767]